jgi:hypothetical protein
MPNYSLCDYTDCPKSKECKRYMLREVENPVVLRFYNICNEKNEYFYQIKMDKQELVVKDGE